MTPTRTSFPDTGTLAGFGDTGIWGTLLCPAQCPPAVFPPACFLPQLGAEWTVAPSECPHPQTPQGAGPPLSVRPESGCLALSMEPGVAGPPTRCRWDPTDQTTSRTTPPRRAADGALSCLPRGSCRVCSCRRSIHRNWSCRWAWLPRRWAWLRRRWAWLPRRRAWLPRRSR